MIRSQPSARGSGRGGSRSRWSSGSSSPERPVAGGAILRENTYVVVQPGGVADTPPDARSGSGSGSGSGEGDGPEELQGFSDMAVSSGGEGRGFAGVKRRAKRVASSSRKKGNREDGERLSPIHKLPPEILLYIFTKLTSPVDHLHCILVCRKWAEWSIELLWHRPYITKWKSIEAITMALNSLEPSFPYGSLIRRLNLNFLAEVVNDGTLQALGNCNRLERLTLTGCKKVSDAGLLKILPGNTGLLTLDLSHLVEITDVALEKVADTCKRLQGLNIAGCDKVTDTSMTRVARSCRNLKRLKLNDCSLITDEAVFELADHCPQLLEVDLHKCHLVTDAAIIALWTKLKQLRELRLANCDRLTDNAFLPLPNYDFKNLRILDLTKCARVTDEAINKIVTIAPRLRNLVLAKCSNITDRGVEAIAKLGKSLHFLHLGHCSLISDDGLMTLIQACPRIRYIDLANCLRLTDASVQELATLPKLRRIGLVKCSAITDEAIMALLHKTGHSPHCALERVHLSYCMNLTVDCIHELLNRCPKLTHLSLTGIDVFCSNPELTRYCRQAPSDFNEHQQRLFCVFSGRGVHELRNYLNARRLASVTYDDGLADGMMHHAHGNHQNHIPGALMNFGTSAPATLGGLAGFGTMFGGVAAGQGQIMAPAPPGAYVDEEEEEGEEEE